MRRQGDIFTLDIFDRENAAHSQRSEPAAGSLSCAAEVCAVITQMIKDSPHDRYEIAARMSRYLGFPINKTTLDAWTADSKHQHRFPFEFTPAFEYATGSHALTHWLASKRGGEFVVGREVLLAELGRIAGTKTELRNYEAEIKQRLKGMTKK